MTQNPSQSAPAPAMPDPMDALLADPEMRFQWQVLQMRHRSDNEALQTLTEVSAAAGLLDKRKAQNILRVIKRGH